MITFKQFLSEGILDKGIFKAIFVIGLPGAGKSYTVAKLKGAISPKVVNTDIAAEFLLPKLNKNISSETWGEFKDSAHRITKNALTQYLNSMLPLFVDGTSNDVSSILRRIGILESIGYDVGVVLVQAPLDVAIKRAQKRAEETGRYVDEDFIKEVYSRNEENANYLKSKVNFFIEVNNSSDELDNQQMQDAFKATASFFNSDIKNPVAKRHINQLKEKGEKYLSPTVIPLETMKKKIESWYTT